MNETLHKTLYNRSKYSANKKIARIMPFYHVQLIFRLVNPVNLMFGRYKYNIIFKYNIIEGMYKYNII